VSAPQFWQQPPAAGFTPELVTAGLFAQQVVYGGGGPVLLFNRDPAVTVYLGSEGDTPGDNDLHILDPLGTVALDGGADVFAFTAAGTAIVQCTPGALSTQASPAEIALQISLSGITSSAPKLLQQLGTFAAGATWGPVTVQVPNGGAYMLALTAAGVNGGSDITVDHLDSAGNVVYEEFFGAIIQSNLTTGPTLVRGNVQGPTLRISGHACNSAFFIAATGSVIAASAVTINAYSLPFSLANDVPKVMGAGFGTGTVAGLLLTADGVAVALGVTTPIGIVQPYAGPATISLRQTTLTTTPTNGRLILAFWSMAGFIASGAALGSVRFNSNTAQLEVQSAYNLPCCLVVAALTNADAAQGTTFFAHITAGAYA
jgi:hypothetical protein